MQKQDESLTDRARLIQPATVVANDRICREHYRLQMSLAAFPPSLPGQYLHLSPQAPAPSPYRTWDCGEYGVSSKRRPAAGGNRTAGCELLSMQWPACDDRIPMLRRAFSIAGLERRGGSTLADVVYRVVGIASRWMQSLHIGDKVSVLGPLGKSFPICQQKPVAWLVAGGVGLPPMFWLAEALHAAGKSVVAFCGAQTAELLALTLDPGSVHSDRPKATPGALKCTLSRFRAAEFAQNRVPVVVSTDDGSLGFHGHVGHALAAYQDENPAETNGVVVYTCGPEPMMRFVAQYCAARQIECHVCMERNMACGLGTCQSCVVPTYRRLQARDANDAEGWRYQLCCTDGPVFDASSIVW